jgi:hypothetical protein
VRSSRSTSEKPTLGGLLTFYGKVVAVMAAAIGLLLLANVLEERWFPKVETRRSALLDAASKSMACPRDQLSVLVESPSRARITGCQRTQVFAWGKVRPGNGIAWWAVDPMCAFTVSAGTVYCH